MTLLESARKALNKSLTNRSAVAGQAHALDSIASSLLYIAENMNNKPVVDNDQIELVVRRLLDDAKAPAVKSAKGKK
jgi:hypothetical protein